jgi:crossover junction endodeoxyribonuclease RuvC
MAKRAASLEAFLAATRGAPAFGRARETAEDPPRRILGIDPGSRITGWGIVECRGPRRLHIASGSIRCATGELAQRLRRILDELEALIAEHTPGEAAIEQVFVRRNVGSSLILGQARGAALCALAGAKLAIGEYAPAQIKSAIVGNGRAEKAQIQFMVTRLLNLKEAPAADAADALAIALCHAQLRGHGKIAAR